MTSANWINVATALVVLLGAGAPAPAATVEESGSVIVFDEEDLILYGRGDVDSLLSVDKAKAGDLQVCYLLALACFARRTRLIELDTAKAYLLRASDGGEPKAQSLLALLVRQGKHFPKDARRVYTLARSSANLGDARGQRVTAEACELGEGGATDRVEALKWYLIAGCQHESVEDKVRALRQKLSPADQREAHRRVYEWKKAHPNVRPLRILPSEAETIAASRRPAIDLALTPGEPGQRFITKFGGMPWWPQGKPRPVCRKGHRLSFVAQIKLADVPGLEDVDDWLLSFHHCSECMPWGYGDKPDAYDLALFSEKAHQTPDGLGVTSSELLMTPSVPTMVRQNDYMSLGDWWETPLGKRERDESGQPYIDITTFGQAVGTPPTWDLYGVNSTKLGGWPSWEQSALWPKCREHRRMRFVGQIDSGDGSQTLWGGGGFAYLFICPPECRHRQAELVIQTS